MSPRNATRTLGLVVLIGTLLMGGGLALWLVLHWGFPAGAAETYARETRFWIFCPFLAGVGAIFYPFVAQGISRHPVRARSVAVWALCGALAGLPFSLSAYLDNGHRAAQVLALATEPGVQVLLDEQGVTLRRRPLPGPDMDIAGRRVPTIAPTYSLSLSTAQFREIVAAARSYGVALRTP